MRSDELLAVLASLLNIVGFVVYNKQIFTGKNTPNITSWGIWAFVTVLNFLSYKTMSDDWVKSIFPTISSLMCILTFLVALATGKFVRVNRYDAIPLALGIMASLVWWWFESATYANLLLQLAIAIGFVPTFRSVWVSPKNEKPLAWFIWGIGFGFGGIVVLMRWNDQYQDVVYYADCFVLHLAVGVTALRKTKEAG